MRIFVSSFVFLQRGAHAVKPTAPARHGDEVRSREDDEIYEYDNSSKIVENVDEDIFISDEDESNEKNEAMSRLGLGSKNDDFEDYRSKH